MTILAMSLAVCSYLIGNINVAIGISRKHGQDIRELGSGSAGTTNIQRNYGLGPSLIVLFVDTAKAVLMVAIGQLLFALCVSKGLTPPPFAYIAGLCVIAGHVFPILHHFKGGKGVAAMLGVGVTLNWQLALIVVVIFLITVATSRYISLGSIIGTFAFVCAETLIAGTQTFATICLLLMGGIIILKHRENIVRLIAGSENKLSFRKKD